MTCSTIKCEGPVEKITLGHIAICNQRVSSIELLRLGFILVDFLVTTSVYTFVVFKVIKKHFTVSTLIVFQDLAT